MLALVAELVSNLGSSRAYSAGREDPKTIAKEMSTGSLEEASRGRT